MKKIVLAAVVSFFALGCYKNNCNQHPDLFSMKFKSYSNTDLNILLLKKNSATVFVFLAPDCPLSQSYSVTLNTLESQFINHSIQFYGVVSGKSYEAIEVNDFVDKYKINFPVIADYDFILADYFNATKTPEVFVLNDEEKILYKGAIDNWAADLGIHRQVVTAFYLADALNNVIENKEVNIKSTDAVGCFIERNKK